jgi:KaiC/GvpD/RAD55 family RecA-like ATPase
MSDLLLSTSIPGLDLVLGGGIRLLSRLPQAGVSGSLLLRGTPGAGKSLLGMQIAVAVADALGGDVACGCVEILPVELDAQLALFTTPKLHRPVLAPPFPQVETGKGRLLAGVIDLGQSGEEPEHLESALLALLDAVRAAGAGPRVLVVDSLSDGYRLGASAPRTLADGLCKLAAEQGLLLILLEETTSGGPSGWSFAVDLVIELARADVSQAEKSSDARRLIVTKNRLGPCDIGIQDLAIDSSGVQVFPRPAAYQQPWVRQRLLPQRFPRAPYPTNTVLCGVGLVSRDSTLVVHGHDHACVSRAALAIGRQAALPQFQIPPDAPGIDVFVAFAGQGIEDLQPACFMGCTDPHRGAARLLSEWLELLESALRYPTGVRRVLVGDLSALRTYAHGAEIRSALYVLSTCCHLAGVPLILFDTTEVIADGQSGTTAARSLLTDFADVLVNVGDHYQTITDRRTNTSYRF